MATKKPIQQIALIAGTDRNATAFAAEFRVFDNLRIIRAPRQPAISANRV
jgi:hypothetical protein